MLPHSIRINIGMKFKRIQLKDITKTGSLSPVAAGKNPY